MTVPQDPAAAGGDRLMAGQADLERVAEMLKDALMQTRLTRNELGARAARALTALTADIPAETGSASPVPPAPARRRPLIRAVVGSGGGLVIAFGAVRLAVAAADPGVTPGSIPSSWAIPCLLVAIAAVVAALFILGYGVGASIEQRRSGRQSPPRAEQGGRAPWLRVTDNADGGGAGGPDVVAW